MKILAYVPHYVGYNHNAGAEMTIHEMLFALRMRGHNITVLLSDPVPGVEPYVIDGIKVQPYASRRDPNYMMPEADLVISHLGTAERAALICKQLGKPHVQVIHNTHHTTHTALLAGCDLAVYNTHWVADHFKSYELKSVVLHPAVRPSAYETERGKGVTLVNLWRNKGSDLFYALAERMPDVSFVGVKGGYQEQDVRVLPNVTVFENLADIREAYQKTKILLMPSAYESYGRCAIEAAASGIPTIASQTPGLWEALGEDGIYEHAPQIAVPGSRPRDWNEKEIAAWEERIRFLLKPAAYGKASKAAKARSQEVWSQTEVELTRFCEAVERMA